jgi:hypothetical protein
VEIQIEDHYSAQWSKAEDSWQSGADFGHKPANNKIIKKHTTLIFTSYVILQHIENIIELSEQSKKILFKFWKTHGPSIL